MKEQTTEELLYRTEQLQKEMQLMAEDMMAKNPKLSYQDCITTFLLWKIAELQEIISRPRSSITQACSCQLYKYP